MTMRITVQCNTCKKLASIAKGEARGWYLERVKTAPTDDVWPGLCADCAKAKGMA